MKITQDYRGIAHHLLLIGFVVIFAVSGVGYMVASKADPMAYDAKVKTNKFRIKAVKCSEPIKSFQPCKGRLKTSRADLYVVGVAGINMRCNGVSLSNSGGPNSYHNFRKTRLLRCTPGIYNIYLAGSQAIMSKDGERQVAALNWNPDNPSRVGGTQKKTLGSIQ